jgi:predicted TIM-barrel fold metal-dependent hydrolase
VIDCDVHCAPASLDALAPYLDPYWLEYARNAGVQLHGLANAYPPVARTAPVPAAVEALEPAVLGRADVEHVILTCPALFEVHRNPYYAAALATAVNEWLRHEWLDRDERLRASIAVSVSAPDLAVEEIERLAGDERFVQVLLPVRAEAPYGNRRYHELLRAAARHGLVVGVHAWGGIGAAALPGGKVHSYLEDYLGNHVTVQSQLLSLVSEGLFVEIPDLRVCLLECGFAWLPALLWRFDKDWKGLWPEIPWVTEPPSSYVRRHVRATTSPAPLAADSDESRAFLELLDAELLVYASDYPNVHGVDPETIETLLGDAAPAVLADNARSLYRRLASVVP